MYIHVLCRLDVSRGGMNSEHRLYSSHPDSEEPNTQTYVLESDSEEDDTSVVAMDSDSGESSVDGDALESDSEGSSIDGDTLESNSRESSINGDTMDGDNREIEMDGDALESDGEESSIDGDTLDGNSEETNIELDSDSESSTSSLPEEMFKPLYPGSTITVCGAYCSIMQYASRNKLLFKAIEDLLMLLKSFVLNQANYHRHSTHSRSSSKGLVQRVRNSRYVVSVRKLLMRKVVTVAVLVGMATLCISRWIKPYREL